MQQGQDAPAKWRYAPQNGKDVNLRAGPSVNAERTGGVLRPGNEFDVADTELGEGGVLFLKLADGRGWVFDHLPGKGEMCVPCEPWEIQTSSGWSPWHPGVAFRGEEGEVVRFVISRRDYMAVFESESRGVQTNVITQQTRAIRKVCAEETLETGDDAVAWEGRTNRGWV